MKKFLLLLVLFLINFNLISFVQAEETTTNITTTTTELGELPYKNLKNGVSITDSGWYDIDTGLWVSDNSGSYFSTNRIKIVNNSINLYTPNIQHILFYNKLGRYIGYYNVSFNSTYENDYFLGNVTTGIISVPNNASWFVMVGCKGVNSNMNESYTYASFNSPIYDLESLDNFKQTQPIILNSDYGFTDNVLPLTDNEFNITGDIYNISWLGEPNLSVLLTINSLGTIQLSNTGVNIDNVYYYFGKFSYITSHNVLITLTGAEEYYVDTVNKIVFYRYHIDSGMTTSAITINIQNLDSEIINIYLKDYERYEFSSYFAGDNYNFSDLSLSTIYNWFTNGIPVLYEEYTLIDLLEEEEFIHDYSHIYYTVYDTNKTMVGGLIYKQHRLVNDYNFNTSDITDQENNLGYFQGNNRTLSVVNGKLECVSNSTSIGSLDINKDSVIFNGSWSDHVGDKYFMTFDIKPKNNITVSNFDIEFLSASDTINPATATLIADTWYNFSFIHELTTYGGPYCIRIFDNGRSGLSIGSKTYFDDFSIMYITNLFNNKQYSELYETTFDLMTDTQIVGQINSWINNNIFTPNEVYDLTNDFGFTPRQEILNVILEENYIGKEGDLISFINYDLPVMEFYTEYSEQEKEYYTKLFWDSYYQRLRYEWFTNYGITEENFLGLYLKYISFTNDYTPLSYDDFSDIVLEENLTFSYNPALYDTRPFIEKLTDFFDNLGSGLEGWGGIIILVSFTIIIMVLIGIFSKGTAPVSVYILVAVSFLTLGVILTWIPAWVIIMIVAGSLLLIFAKFRERESE